MKRSELKIGQHYALMDAAYYWKYVKISDSQHMLTGTSGVDGKEAGLVRNYDLNLDPKVFPIEKEKIALSDIFNDIQEQGHRKHGKVLQ